MKTLITGATSDLGKALAKVFANNNYDLILTYHNDKETCEKLKIEIEEKYKVHVDIEFLEILDENLITKIVDKYEIDILINNAAKTHDEDLLTKTVESFKDVVNTNINCLDYEEYVQKYKYYRYFFNDQSRW